MKVRIDYLSRVEGEAAVSFEIGGGKLKDLKVNIWEPPRFFEGFMVGRSYAEAPDLVARICGICPVSHMTTAIRALERALGLEPPPETRSLQKIMALSQLASSHLVHLYMLALPDYFRMPSAAALLPAHRAEVERLIRMKEVLNGVSAAFGGRALHPVAMVVAGFTSPPSRQCVGGLIGQLEGIRDDALETLKMVASLDVPGLERPREYVALRGEGGYAINGGNIASSRGIDAPEDDYGSFFEERQVPYANAKRTTVRGRDSLMVGALARLNLKFGELHPEAREAAAGVGFAPPSDNPFHNNLAQAVEVVHAINECIEALDSLPGEYLPWVDIKVREGEGHAVTEAPRGLLYHYYAVDQRGNIEKANIVTPTAHNFLGIEQDLRALIERYIDEPREEIALKCEMLVRAYDPCFSCSVH